MEGTEKISKCFFFNLFLPLLRIRFESIRSLEKIVAIVLLMSRSSFSSSISSPSHVYSGLVFCVLLEGVTRVRRVSAVAPMILLRLHTFSCKSDYRMFFANI